MKCVVQRVISATVTVSGQIVGQTPSDRPGLLVFVGIDADDTHIDAQWMAEKLVNLRIFRDHEDKLNRSLIDVGGTALLVPNFTVVGNAQKGRRPSFDRAMKPAESERFFEQFTEDVRRLHPNVQTGQFRAHMHVALVNDGPITLVIDSPPRAPASAR